MKPNIFFFRNGTGACEMSTEQVKPHIKAHYSQPSCNLKWQCVSPQSSYDEGRDYQRIGTGYSPKEAYDKWLRHGRNYKAK